MDESDRSAEHLSEDFIGHMNPKLSERLYHLFLYTLMGRYPIIFGEHPPQRADILNFVPLTGKAIYNFTA